jgi:thiol-disulfide isomerase/thioredoxin
MRSLLFVLIILMALLIACKTTSHVSRIVESTEQPAVHVSYSDASTWIIGYFKVNRLMAEPHSEWFVKGMDEYSGDRGVLDSLKAIITEMLSVKIVMGTWCPDSRREVPRFMRILKDINFPADRVSMIGVDNVKFSPIDNYDALGIERVPTFIFYKNNIEIGRIIENPATSLERDMLNILSRNEKN